MESDKEKIDKLHLTAYNRIRYFSDDAQRLKPAGYNSLEAAVKDIIKRTEKEVDKICGDDE